MTFPNKVRLLLVDTVCFFICWGAWMGWGGMPSSTSIPFIFSRRLTVFFFSSRLVVLSSSFSDFQLMFSMNGPRRKGDIGRYHMLVKRLDKK